MKLRTLAIVALLFVLPATAWPQALTNLSSLRVGYNTRKNTVKPEGPLKAQIDALDAQIAEAARLGKKGELRPVFTKGGSRLNVATGSGDGGYVLVAEVTDQSTSLGAATLPIALRKGLDDTIARLEGDAKRAPDTVRAEILFPVDRLRNVNRGRLELRTFDPERDLASAEAVVASLKTRKDPFAGRTGDFKRHYLLDAAHEIIPYRMYVPTTDTGAKASPLVIALHGLGGTEDSSFEGYDKQLPPLAERHGYIVAAPLGYRVDGSYGWGVGNAPADPTVRRTQELSEQDVMQVLQRVRQQYKIDENRIYLMGHSMGGIGTWKIAAKYPDIWAAIGPISGSGAPATIERFRHIPEVVVHGDNDATVNVSGSRNMVEKMKELGVEVKYIEVPGGSHGGVAGPNIGAILDFFDAHKKATRSTSQP